MGMGEVILEKPIHDCEHDSLAKQKWVLLARANYSLNMNILQLLYNLKG